MTPDHKIDALDWPRVEADLDQQGIAKLPQLLTARQCATLTRSYADRARFRSRVVMARHGFGRGEYQYFANPLPALVQQLRESLYARLAPVANRWGQQLGSGPQYPGTHRQFQQLCHRAHQTRPTPLLLRYGEGDYNCLHQDLYGEVAFPLQVIFMLSEPGKDFEGGELVLVEQRPRRQSRPRVVSLSRGEAVVITTHNRPVEGKRGYYRVVMKHGVSQIDKGERYTLGIIFHDAAGEG